MAVQIKTIRQLKHESMKGARFFLLLNKFMRSSKWISWDGSKFYIMNEIDGSEQRLTERQIRNPYYSNIGLALDKGFLFKESAEVEA